jgi:hypothetical protein
MQPIVTTENYFSDLNLAIAEGLFLSNAKPKKVDLYNAIASHNKACEIVDAPTQVVTQPEKHSEEIAVVEPVGAVRTVTKAKKNAYAELRQQWNNNRAMKGVKAVKAASQKTEKPGLTEAQEGQLKVLVAGFYAEDKSDRIRNAYWIHGVVELVGTTKAAELLTLSVPNVARQARSYELFTQSKVIADNVKAGLLSWAKLHAEIATKTRKTPLEELEQLARDIIAEAQAKKTTSKG